MGGVDPDDNEGALTAGGECSGVPSSGTSLAVEGLSAVPTVAALLRGERERDRGIGMN